MLERVQIGKRVYEIRTSATHETGLMNIWFTDVTGEPFTRLAVAVKKSEVPQEIERLKKMLERQ